jgi:hypothetical protein
MMPTLGAEKGVALFLNKIGQFCWRTVLGVKIAKNPCRDLTLKLKDFFFPLYLQNCTDCNTGKSKIFSRFQDSS